MLILALLILVGIWALYQHRQDLADAYGHITVDGRERQYRVHLPDGYDENETYPLLLALHGGGGSARHFQESRDFDVVADEHGFIVVYPDGIGRFPYRMHTWNSGYLDTYAYQHDVDDVSFLRALITHLPKEYPVAASQVYMAGHSNGGMMAYRFAAEHPDVLAAVAPVSASVGGQMYEDDPVYLIPEPSQPCSVVHVHGCRDSYVPYNGGQGENSRAHAHLSVNKSISFWVDANGCRAFPTGENSTTGAIQLARYPGGRDGTEVTLITFTRDGHHWTDMSDTVAAEEYHGETLAELVWNRLSTYRQQSSKPL